MKHLVTWWGNLSVSKKLYVVVGIMAMLIATELFTLLFAMNTLSAVRSLVGGESLWSKAQKNALLEIQIYARTADEHHYSAFLDQVKIPWGDHVALMAMEKPGVDVAGATYGFRQGQNEPEDIPGMIRLLTRFHWIRYIGQAIQYWRQGDDLMFQLIETAGRLHAVMQATPDPNSSFEIHSLLNEIISINDKLTAIEIGFSSTLGEASRWLEHLLKILLIAAVATVESSGLLLTVTVSRNLSKDLTELDDFAAKIGQGEFGHTLPVRSRDEIGRLARSLNKMAADLKESTGERQLAERANRVKNLFLANMSHEIRTPLNAVLGFVELLKDPALSDLKRRRYLEIIERTGQTVATIINDILDISKVEAGKLEIEPSAGSLRQVLTDLKAMLTLRCEEKGIYLTFNERDLPEFITTDLTRYKQVLINIIGNAIKFTSSGGVTADFSATDSRLTCTVSDTGIGISGENASKLFRPFSQVDPSIRKQFGGTGLGLILSKRLATLLGGDVVLEQSEPGRGSKFVITISYQPSNVRSLRYRQDDLRVIGQTLAGKRILLVEDSVDNQVLTEQFLVREGAQVDIACHGLEAVDRVGKCYYDLVLMDMQMPVMDGYAATAHLRAMGFHQPIIALTAHAMKEDLEKCLSAGCSGCICKPIRRDGLVSLIGDFCRQAA